MKPNLDYKSMATSLAKQGRGKDSMLAHVTPAEMRLLKSRGGSGTTNPKTGLYEFDTSGGAFGGDSSGGIESGSGALGSSFGGGNTGGALGGVGGAGTGIGSSLNLSYDGPDGSKTKLTGGGYSPGMQDPVDQSVSTTPSTLGTLKGVASPIASILSGGLSASPFGALGSILANQGATDPGSIVGDFAGLSPVTALGFGLTGLLKALGAEVTGPPTSSEPSHANLLESNLNSTTTTPASSTSTTPAASTTTPATTTTTSTATSTDNTAQQKLLQALAGTQTVG